MTCFDAIDDFLETGESMLNWHGLNHNHQTPRTRLIVILSFACFGLANSAALGQATSKLPSRVPPSPNVSAVHATSQTKGIGWKRLTEMPEKLGRFQLATDGKLIYRLGGVGFNIRTGGSYSSQLAVFNPESESWLPLAEAPFGTGGASVAYWPSKHSLVAIAGIKKLGEQFNMDGVTVGVYDITADRWSMQKFACAGLGRPSWLIHSADGKFLVLTSSHGLGSAENFAELDLNKSTLRIVSNCPVPGRMVAVAKHHGTIFIVQSTKHGPDQKRARVHQFDIWADQHVSIVELQEEFTHVDALFVWKDHLMMWKNSGDFDQNRFQWPTKLIEINCTTGECVETYAGLPSPQARRSSNGIFCGNAFYIFGGQREDSIWLQDSYRFDFQ